MGAFKTLTSNNSSNQVSVTSTGSISTKGRNSTGLLAQSIGGGGGFIGLNTANDYRVIMGSTRSAGLNNSSDIDIFNQSSIV